ncbi:hypothetical protein Q5512_17480 [Escherichia coli]|nr:hypothetical protein [Escherichia coli]
MKFQMARIYKGDLFACFGIAVNGELLEGQLSSRINTEAINFPSVTIEFRLTCEEIGNSIDINVNEILTSKHTDERYRSLPRQ